LEIFVVIINGWMESRPEEFLLVCIRSHLLFDKGTQMKQSLLVIALVALAVSACGKKEEVAPVPAPAPAPVAAPAPAAPAAEPAAPAAAPAGEQKGMEGMAGMSGMAGMEGKKEEPKK
jgi:hypothetical protein